MTKPVNKILFTLTLVIFFIALSTVSNKIDNRIHRFFLEGKTLNCVVHAKGGIYLKRGVTKGFHYDLLKEFCRYEKCNSVIKPYYMNDFWGDLISGKTDILVINSSEPIPEEYQADLISSTPLNLNDDVWVVKKSNYDLLLHLNEWFSFFQQKPLYSQLINTYYKRYNFIALTQAAAGNKISPFDKIIKKYSNKIGWDWRLVASLIYQESGFDNRAKSHRGSHGLMQIQNTTAQRFGVSDPYDPEQNIMAGTRLLQKLDRMYSGIAIDSASRIKFVLAAYNAGEGRINDLISYARHKGYSTYNWDTLKRLIPEMKRDIIPEGILKFGIFKGVETVKHVDEVLNRYEEYKSMVES